MIVLPRATVSPWGPAMMIAVPPDCVTFQPAGTPAEADPSDAVKGCNGIDGLAAAGDAGAAFWATVQAVKASAIAEGMTSEKKRYAAGVDTSRFLRRSGNGRFERGLPCRLGWNTAHHRRNNDCQQEYETTGSGTRSCCRS